MPTTNPFAYNTGSTISGTEQFGNLAVGVPTSGFESTGLKWWNGPDQELGYVIAHETPTGQSGSDGDTAYLGFWRTDSIDTTEFVNLSNFVANRNNTPQNFTDGDTAKSWLESNGFWSSFDNGFQTSKYRVYNTHPQRNFSGLSVDSVVQVLEYGGTNAYGDGYPVLSATTGWSQTRAEILTSTPVNFTIDAIVPLDSWTFPTVFNFYKNGVVNRLSTMGAFAGQVTVAGGSFFSDYTSADTFTVEVDLYRGIFPGNSGFTYLEGMVVNYDFSDSDCWDGTSSDVIDLGSNSPYPYYQYSYNNDGVQSGGTYNSGNGGYMVFNGSTTHIKFGIPTWNISPVIGFTKQAWIYRNSSTGSQNILSTYDAPFWFNGNTLSAGFGGNYSVITATVTTLNQWIHVAVSFNDIGNRITLFVNGEIVNNITTFAGGFNPYDYTYVGSHVTASGTNGTPVSFFNGRIGEVQYYNYPLDARTMLFNYNITKSRYGY
jgi:hypothetical protein